MSTTLITVTPAIVGGTVASVSFTGLTNADTGAALSPSPALPQPFTANAAGTTWTYALTNIPGVALYGVSFAATLTTGQVFNGYGTKEASLATGIYASETDLDNQFGIANVTAWSDLDNASARNADRIQVALNRADQWVVQRFTKERVTIPVNGSPYYPSLRYLAAQYAGTWLARARGANQAENGKATGVQDDNKQEAEAELQEIIDAIQFNANLATASPTLVRAAHLPHVRSHWLTVTRQDPGTVRVMEGS